MNLFQNTENKKFDSNQIPMSKCDLLVISIFYKDTNNCCFTLIINPQFSVAEEFDLIHNYSSIAIGNVPEALLSFIKTHIANNMEIYSADSVINHMMQSTNPKLVQVIL